MKLSPDTLTYIQNVKTFFKNNSEARDYFLKNIEEDLFFDELGKIAESNFKDNGNPTLDRNQFESLRTISKPKIDDSLEDRVFVDMRGIGKICLN